MVLMRKRYCPNPLCSGFFEDTGDFLNGGACCLDIIYQNNSFPSYGGFSGEGKSVNHVLFSFIYRNRYLTLGVLNPSESSCIKGKIEMLGDARCNEHGLIKPAHALFFIMKGDRNHYARSGKRKPIGIKIRGNKMSK